MPFALFDWTLVAVRGALLASVVAAVQASSYGSPLALVCIVALWSLVLARALGLSVGTGTASLGVELALLGCVCTKTLTLAYDANASTTGDLVWIAPLGLACVHAVLLDLLREEKQPPAVAPLRVVWFRVCLVFACAGGVVTVLIDDAQTTTTTSVIVGIADVLATVILLFASQRAPATGVAQWVWLSLATTPVVGFGIGTGVTIGGVVGATILCQAVLEQHGQVVRSALATLVGSLHAALDWIGAIVASPVPYQFVAVASVVVLLSTIRVPWYATQVDFPPVLQQTCYDIVWIIDTIVKPVYVFTSESSFQDLILPVLPEIGQVRATLYKIITAAYGPLSECADGHSYTFVASQSGIFLITLVPVVLVGVVVVLLQVFPRTGGVFARSQWTWRFGALFGFVSLGIVQLAADAPAAFWYHIFDQSTYARVYTTEGQYALAAQLAFIAACLANACVCEHRDVKAREARRTARPLGGALRDAVRDTINYLLAPSMVLTAAAVLIVVVTALSAGSPITHIGVEKVTSGATPTWLVSTPFDTFASTGVFSSMDDLIDYSAEALGSSLGEVRMALILTELGTYAVEQMGDWQCLCLPIPSWSEIVGGVEDAGNAITGFFSGFRRRRLLEHRADRTTYGHTAVGHPRRRILSFVDAGASCSETRICVSDVVTDIVNLLTKAITDGMAFAFKLVVGQLLSRIPFLSALDDVVSKLSTLYGYIDFDLFALPELTIGVSLSLFGLDLGMLPSFRVPSAPTLGTVVGIGIPLLVVCVVGVVVAWRAGLLDPVIRSTKIAVETTLISCAIALAFAVASFALDTQSTIRTYGYDVVIEWNTSAVYAYGTACAVLAVAFVSYISEHVVGEKMDDPLRYALVSSSSLAP
jgi:hypothetical protein